MQNNNMTVDLVSVIIPVFNVETYLKRCVDSILNQTYTNLDVILVDDGSTDRSSEICDYYASSDQRVRVIHKNNGGLSDARNAGLDTTRGEYLYFIDSDDFIAKDTIAFLHESMIKTGADIVTHSYQIYRDEEMDIKLPPLEDNDQHILDCEDALEYLLYENHVTTSACMKLYKRRLFGSRIRFPFGKICEDLATVYKVFSKANKIILNTIPLYYYFQRAGSLTQSGFNANSTDGLDIAKVQLEYIARNHPTLLIAAQYRLFAEAIYIVMKMPLDSRQYKYERKEVYRIISKYRASVLFNYRARPSMRLRALAALCGVKNMVYLFKTMQPVTHHIKKVIG